MLLYSYNNIIIAPNVVVLGFFSPRFVHPGAPHLIILYFSNTS